MAISPLRIGAPSYLNALPFVYGLKHQPLITVQRAVPSAINCAFLQGKIDCALMSSVEILRHNLPTLPFGIIAQGAVHSVHLYSRKPLSALDGVTIGVTEESATSTHLLKLLARAHWRVTPHFVPMATCLNPQEYTQEREAFLLIGDAALTHPTFNGYHTTDLASAWYEMRGLPFPFALFAYPPHLECHKGFLTTLLESALQAGERSPESMLEAASTTSTLSHTCLQNYWRALRFRVDARAEEALKDFHMLLQTHHVL